jgi:signal transduction histidine kinase
VSGEGSRVLAEEQRALRRVATLVARGVPPEDVFAAVTEEVWRLLPADIAGMSRYEPDGTITAVAISGSARDSAPIPVGRSWRLGGKNINTTVFETGRPARVDSYGDADGALAVASREYGVRSAVGTPVIVEGRLWGVIGAYSTADRPLPEDTEERLASFTELVATAISNADARAELGRLAEEQAALRRVATLVAHGVPPSELFGAVTEEVGMLLRVDLAGMVRYEGDDAVTPVATWAAAGKHPDVPGRWPMEEGDPATLIAETRRPVRIDDWDGIPGPIAAFIRDEAKIRSSVGSPIVVDGRLWGALAVHAKHAGRLPADTESRLENFTELVAAAMSNVQARAEMQRLAEEQAALRRVATLVARGVPASQLFSAVAEEAGKLLCVDLAAMVRHEADHTVTVVATWAATGEHPQVGVRFPIEEGDLAATVWRTAGPARIDGDRGLSGQLVALRRELGIRSSVAAPIVVEGQLWGGLVVHTKRAETLPADTESRLMNFTELVATGISNILARSDLAASRARIVAATDDERRRVVRDLHDGAQQRLVHTIMTLNQARSATQNAEEDAPALVAQALDHTKQAMAELRELAHGILPGVLMHGGLHAAVEALASRMPVPVENAVSVGRLPAPLEATGYFVVAEALTNVAKHAHAGHAAVTARIEEGKLRVQVRDDGVGGARAEGSGLLGLADRLAVLDGQLRVESPADGGTLVAADIPVPA